MVGVFIVAVVLLVVLWCWFQRSPVDPDNIAKPSLSTSNKVKHKEQRNENGDPLECRRNVNRHNDNGRDPSVYNRENSAIYGGYADDNQQPNDTGTDRINPEARTDSVTSREAEYDQDVPTNRDLEFEHVRYRKRRGKCADDVMRTDAKEADSTVADDNNDDVADSGSVFDADLNQNKSLYVPYHDTFGEEKHFKVRPTPAQVQNFEVCRQRRKKSDIDKSSV